MNRYPIAFVLLLGLMYGEVEANDRYMVETMELVVLFQKLEDCIKIEDDKTRLGCFDNVPEKIKAQMKIFQNALDFKVPKENWYGLPAETATAKKKKAQNEHKWWEEFLIDAERVVEKIEWYLE